MLKNDQKLRSNFLMKIIQSISKFQTQNNSQIWWKLKYFLLGFHCYVRKCTILNSYRNVRYFKFQEKYKKWKIVLQALLYFGWKYHRAESFNSKCQQVEVLDFSDSVKCKNKFHFVSVRILCCTLLWNQIYFQTAAKWNTYIFEFLINIFCMINACCQK